MCPTHLRISSRHGRPRQRTSPASGSSTPRMIRMAVVLPAPLGPTNPKYLPLADREGRSSRATTSPCGGPAAIPTRRPAHPGSHPDVRVLTRTLAAGPVGGVRPGEELGVLLGSYRVGLGRDCAGPPHWPSAIHCNARMPGMKKYSPAWWSRTAAALHPPAELSIGSSATSR